MKALPEVGSVVEYYQAYIGWISVEIIAHHRHNAVFVFDAVDYDGLGNKILCTEYDSCGDVNKFREATSE